MDCEKPSGPAFFHHFCTFLCPAPRSPKDKPAKGFFPVFHNFPGLYYYGYNK